MSSLGFNQLRPQRVHSLPGATHSQAVPAPRRRRPMYSASPPLPPPPPPASSQVVPTLPPSALQLPSTASTLHSGSAPMLSRRMQFLEDAFKKSSELAEQFRNTRDEASQSMQELYEQTQVVYGTARAKLVNEEDTEVVVATPNTKLALFYPMTTDDDGKTIMRAKVVDPITARISLVPVCVYDPGTSPARRVTDFSAVPN